MATGEQEELGGAAVVDWMNFLWGVETSVSAGGFHTSTHQQRRTGEREGGTLKWCLLHGPGSAHAAQRDRLAEPRGSERVWDLAYESREPAGEETSRRGASADQRRHTCRFIFNF